MLGFGVTLVLWLLAGIQMSRRMQQVEAQTAEINSKYSTAQELLSTVRAQVLLGAVAVRDALLDLDPDAAASYRQEFDRTYRRADNALRRYHPMLDTPDETERVAQLRREIDDFHLAMVDVLDIQRQNSPIDAATLLRERVTPRREVVLNVSEQVQQLNTQSFIRLRDETSDLNREAQRHVWQRLGLALAASICIGFLATLYAGRLQGQIRRQRARDLRITDDLHRLSARLATAQEDERRAISRELHDEVGQALTAIRVELGLVLRTSGLPPLAAARVEDARAISEDTLRTIRDLSHLLHPALLDDLGLAAALKNYLEGFSKRHGVRTELLHEQMEERLAPELEVALYRIVQEALTNVAKHAHASVCRVYLQGLTTTVLVTIEDDGSGFDASEIERLDHARGLGLISIRERAEQLGGTFRLETAPGQGTRLTIEMPARRHARVDTTPDLPESGDLTDGEPAHLSR